MSMQRTVNSKRRKEAEKAALKLREQYQAKKRLELEAKHRNISEKSAQWNEQILPRWSEIYESKQVGDLCMKGIPPSIRGKVWPLLIGNNLKITFELFQNLVALAELSTTEQEIERKANTPKSPRKNFDPVASGEDTMHPIEENDNEGRQDSVVGERVASLDHVMEREWQQLRRKITNEGLGLRHDRVADAGDDVVGGEEISVSREMEREWQQLKRKITNEGLNRPMYDTFESQRHGTSSLMKETEVLDPVTPEQSPRDDPDNDNDNGPEHLTVVGGEDCAIDGIHGKTRADSDPGSFSMTASSPGGAALSSASSGRVVDLLQKDPLVMVDESFVADAEEPSYLEGSPDIRRDKHSMDYLVSAGLVAGTPPLPSRSTGSDIESRGVTWSPDLTVDRAAAGVNSISLASDGNEDSHSDSSPIHLTDSTGVSIIGDASDDAAQDEYVQGADLYEGISHMDLTEEYESDNNDDIDTKEAVFGLKGEDWIGNTPPRRRKTVAIIQTIEQTGNMYNSIRESMSSSPGDVSMDRHRSLGSCVGSAEINRLQHERLEVSTQVLLSSNLAAASSMSPDAFKPTMPGMKRVTSLDALSSSSSKGSAKLLMQAAQSGPKAMSARDPASEKPATIHAVSTPISDSSQNRANSSQNASNSASSAMKTHTVAVSAPSSSSRQTETKNTKSPAPESPVSRRHTIKLIEFDIPRTFPTLAFFHDGGPLHVGLVRVLKAYACYRADVGYVQGMSYIVSMLLLYMDELQAFQCLSNLLSRRGNMDFYRLKKFAIDAFVLCFDFFFKQHLPLLYMHMKGEGVTSEMYLMDWNLSLFAKALPLEVAARLWDMYLFEGEVFVTRAALGILRMYAPKLCTLSMEEIMSFLINLPPNVDADILLANIDQIRISKRRYEEMRNKMTSELQARVNGSKTQDTTPSQSQDHGKTSAFKGIKRALRATFLGSTSSSETGSGSHGTPTRHGDNHNHQQQQHQQHLQQHHQQAHENTGSVSSGNSNRTLQESKSSSSLASATPGSSNNRSQSAANSSSSSWRDVGDDLSSSGPSGSGSSGSGSGAGNTQALVPEGVNRAQSQNNMNNIDSRNLNMNANDMLPRHTATSTSQPSARRRNSPADREPLASPRAPAGQSSDCVVS